MLTLLLVANALLSLAYLVVKAGRKELGSVALLFLFLPGLGFLLFFLPYLVQRVLRAVGIDRDAILVQVHDIDAAPEHPNLREELDVVPVADAVAVSENRDKRSLLLQQLRRDLKDTYKLLQAAEQDEDSESVHYVAAAKMEVYRLHQQYWLGCRKDYEEDPTNVENYHDALGALNAILDSNVYSAREENVYRKRFCMIVAAQIARDESVVTEDEYERYLRYLIDLENYGAAEHLWETSADRMRSEATYTYMLKMFYSLGQRAKFQACLNDLRRNKQVRLSSQGLEQLRYWSDRLSATQGAQPTWAKQGVNA